MLNLGGKTSMNLYKLLCYLDTENGNVIETKMNMWIILLPKDTEFEEDHSYKTLLKMCLF